MNLEIWSRIYLDGREAADVTAELRELDPRSATRASTELAA